MPDALSQTSAKLTAADIMKLVATFGPGALTFVENLLAIWHKPELTKEDLVAVMTPLRRSYDDWINAEVARKP